MSETAGPGKEMHRTTRWFLSCTGHIVLAIVLLALAGPVSATDWTLTPADNIQNNITLASPGDTLILNPGTYTENGITVTKSLTIRANTSYSGTAANTIIDGSYNQIITVNGGVTLTIDNLTLENGEVTGAGGAIINEGTLTVTSSTFTGCRARFAGGSGSGIGGAIHNAGTITSITTSSFTNCTAIYGGAIYNEGTITGITSTSFTDCTANGWGNAIYNAGTITSLTFSTFNRCLANGRYAIYNDSGTITALDNWWGNNTPVFSSLINGAPAPASWLVLGITASPSSITSAQTSLINTNLTWDSDGIYHNPASGHVPDGIAISFSSTSGTLAPASGSMASGANSTRFTPAGVGTTNISATVDGQTVYTLVTVAGPVFTGTPVTGTTPLAVTFTDASVGSPTLWNWSFGDGTWFNTTSAAASSPVHTYTSAGTYTVSLTTTISGTPATLTRAGYITVAAPPTPVPTTQAPVQVPPASDPGDGSSSDSIPSPFYPSVSLTVNIGGNSAVGHAEVTGSGINDLIITGLTLGSPGPNIPPPPGTVYQFIGLVPARFTSITAAAITFTVPAAWLEENGILPGNVVLYHYENGAWVALPTTVVSTANGIVKFTATSPGFSLFAIAGQPGTNVTVTLTATPQVQMFGSQVAQSVPAPATVTPAPVMQQTTAAPATIQPPAALPIPTIVLVAAGIMALVGGGFMVRRWWIRRQNPALFAEDE